MKGPMVERGELRDRKWWESPCDFQERPVDMWRAAHAKSDLLPCPFCGAAPLSYTERHRVNGNIGLKILCGGRCYLMMFTVCEPDNEEEARDKLTARWNRRVPSPISTGEPQEREAGNG